jgi:signal transduction histidine kinase/HAMP domain-containing protein
MGDGAPHPVRPPRTPEAPATREPPPGGASSWLQRTPVRTKLAWMTGAFVASFVLLLLLTGLSLKISNGVRAYVAGEGLWSRAQKDATFALDRYARTRAESDYQAYVAATQVMLGDRAARLELQKPDGDEAVAVRGFIQGRNDPADVPDMIFLFRYFQDFPYLREAITFWTEGDLLMARMGAIAAALRPDAPGASDPAAIARNVAELEAVSAELTKVELRFSATLAEGARWIHRTLVTGAMAFTALLLGLGVLMARRVSAQLREGITVLTAGTSRVSAGDLGTLIPVKSSDELGELAQAFNAMIAHRRAAAEALDERLRFETLVTRLSSSMTTLTPERVDEGINGALADLGQFAQVDRAYVFEFSDDGTAVTCSHEWCAAGIAPQIGRLQNIAVDEFPWVEEKLRRGEVVHVPRVADLPVEAAAERREWQAESIQSLLLIPMRTGARIRGYVGFDSVRAAKAWPRESNDLLRIFGEIVLNTLTRVKAEQALLEQNRTLAQTVDELGRSNAELEQFAYAASHDLNTPLRGIAGFIQLLRRRLAGQLDAQTDEYITLALRSAHQMQDLIAGLLEMLRIGRDAAAAVPTDGEAALADVRTQLGPLLTERDVRLTHDPLPTVTIAPAELQQVLANLIGNAIKFQPGPRPQVHVSAARDGAFWRFSVRDQGIGIRREHQAKIFQLFQRLHTSDAYEGSGIGLAICRKIVQRHGGRIWVESDGSTGSTFHFTLKA